MMACKTEASTAILLVQATGRGKSMVPMTIGTVTQGVIVVVENTQALLADQIRKHSTAGQQCGTIEAFQLGSTSREIDQKELCDFLHSLSDKSSVTVFSHTSPERLLKLCCAPTTLSLIHNDAIKLLHIDEVHQLTSFGSSFRPEFGSLCGDLLEKLTINNATQQSSASANPTNLHQQSKMPLLMITAAIDEKTKTNLQKITGIKITPSMIVWGW